MDPQNIVPTVPPSVDSPKPKNNSVLITLSLLLMILVGIVAFLGYQNFLLQKQISLLTATTTVSPTPTTTADPTANWKTYTNTKYGFSFKYPNDYLVYVPFTDIGYDIFILSSQSEKSILENCIKNKTPECNNYSIGIKFTKQSKSPDQTIEDFYKFKFKGVELGNYSLIKIDNLPALQTRFEGIGNVVHTYVNQDNQVTDIYGNIISNQDMNTKIYDQILSTFKFLGQNASNKSCSNTDIKISLSIPSDWICSSTETSGAGWIKITSSFFEMNMSQLGRGPFCEPSSNDPQSPMYDPTHACQVTNFYTNSLLSVDLYKLKGENKEIFGTINNGPWISVTWNNMATTDLTPDQKAKIISVFNSITKTQ